MPQKIILTGDINLLNVADPNLPFNRVAPEFREADFVFSNLECCLYDPPRGAAVDEENEKEGFFAAPGPGGQALKAGNIDAVGIANNVNFGDEAIVSSVARLDALGIPHTGAGGNAAAARAPVILESGGLRVGIMQRTTVYWPRNHEATKGGPGVAALRANTAYQVPMHKTRKGMTGLNRAGLPPLIVTWIDPPYLKQLKEDIAALRSQCDIVVASIHWGYRKEVLEYMQEAAHAAIDAGADIVMGHGPHYALGIEVYEGKPIYYGLGCFSFHTGHSGATFGDWVGIMARLSVDGKKLRRASYQFVRHNERNETVLCPIGSERDAYEDISKLSALHGTRFTVQGDEVFIALE